MKHKVSGFNTHLGKHCLFSSLANIMNHLRYNLKEAEVFLLFNGFDIRYYVQKNIIVTTLYEEQLKSIQSIVTGTTRNVSDIGRRLAVREVEESINHNIPVLLRIANQYLKYDEVYQESEAYIHHIILYGYDHDDNMVSIADTYKLTASGTASQYNGNAALEDIYYGMSSFLALQKNPGFVYDKEYFVNLFQKEFKEFLDGSLPQEGYYKGHCVVRQYIENLRLLHDLDDPTFEEKCLHAIFDLKFGCIYHMIDYLMELIQEVLPVQNKDNLINELASLKDEWGDFFILLCKVGYSRRRSKLNGTIEIGVALYEKSSRLYHRILGG